MSGRYEHPHAGFSLTVPMPFAILEEAADRAILGLDAPGDSTLVLMVEALPGDMRADELAGAGLEALARELGAFRLIDRASAGIGGERGVRTLSSHVADGRAMTLEQWRLAAGGEGLILTGSCPTLEYSALAEVFDAVAASLRR